MQTRTSCHVRLTAKSAKLGRNVLNSIQDQRAPKTIGEHIRQKRLELRKCQKGGSHALGVSLKTLSNWENGTSEPLVRHIPKIIEFLGYVPFVRGETLGERIAIYRKTLGLNHTQFAKKLGVARCTVFGWEHNQVKNVEKKIRPYLDGLVEFD